MSSFFKSLWSKKPQPDNVMQNFLDEIEGLKKQMKSLREVFEEYGHAIQGVAKAGDTLATTISKFNQDSRPNHPPVITFQLHQSAFARDINIQWSSVYNDEVVYMFDHWNRQSEAQKNTIANYEIARQHCYHLKQRVSELHEQRGKLVDRGRPVPEQLSDEIIDVEGQFRKYSVALENMRVAIITNQSKLTGAVGQFLYFDKAFMAFLEQQGRFAHKFRHLTNAYRNIDITSDAPIAMDHVDGAAISSSMQGTPQNPVFGAENRVREIAEFIYHTYRDRMEMIGCSSASLDTLDKDIIYQQFESISTPVTPALSTYTETYGSPSLFHKHGNTTGNNTNVTRTPLHINPDALFTDSMLNSPKSPFHLFSAKKKRMSTNGFTSSLPATPEVQNNLSSNLDNTYVDTNTGTSISQTPNHDAHDTSADYTGKELRKYLEPLVEYDEYDNIMTTTGTPRTSISRSPGHSHASPHNSTNSGVTSVATTQQLMQEQRDPSLMSIITTVDTLSEMKAKYAAWLHPVSMDCSPSRRKETQDISLHDAADVALLPSVCNYSTDRRIRDTELRAWEYIGTQKNKLKELLATLHVVAPKKWGWKQVGIMRLADYCYLAELTEKALKLCVTEAEAGRAEAMYNIEHKLVEYTGLELDSYVLECGHDGTEDESIAAVQLHKIICMRIFHALLTSVCAEWDDILLGISKQKEETEAKSTSIQATQQNFLSALEEAAQEHEAKSQNIDSVCASTTGTTSESIKTVENKSSTTTTTVPE